LGLTNHGTTALRAVLPLHGSTVIGAVLPLYGSTEQYYRP